MPSVSDTIRRAKERGLPRRSAKWVRSMSTPGRYGDIFVWPRPLVSWAEARAKRSLTQYGGGARRTHLGDDQHATKRLTRHRVLLIVCRLTYDTTPSSLHGWSTPKDAGLEPPSSAPRPRVVARGSSAPIWTPPHLRFVRGTRSAQHLDRSDRASRLCLRHFAIRPVRRVQVRWIGPTRESSSPHRPPTKTGQMRTGNT